MATTTDARTRFEFVESRATEIGKIDRERQFYAVAAFTMLFITVVGFREFLLHGRAVGGVPITSQIVLLVVAHGLAMLGWVVLFCVQSALIVADRRRMHMRLGRIGALLAGAIVIFGVAVAPLSVHYNPAAYADFGGARYFLGLIWPEPVTFGVFVALALARRARPEVHRPMMLLATVQLMTGSLVRAPYWDALVRFVDGSIAVAMLGQMLALGAILLAAHAMITQRINQYFLVGYGGLTTVSILCAAVARSAGWDRLAALIVH